MKKIIAAVLVVVMIFALCACGAQPAAKEAETAAPAAAPAKEAETASEVPVVKVGALYPFSGGSSTAGPEAQFLIDYVVNQINEEGGLENLGGAKIEVIYGDTQGDGEIAKSELDRLVNVEGCTVLIGGYNTAVANTLSQSVIAEQVPMLITSAAGNDAFAVDNEYVYHANDCGALDPPTANRFEAFKQEILGEHTTSLVVYDSADYGAQAWEDKRRDAEANGNTVIGVPVVSGAADYSAEIAKIQNSGAQYIVPTLIMDDAIRLQKQMFQKGVTMPIFASGGGYVQGDFIAQCGDAANYVFSTSWYFHDVARTSYDPEYAEQICGMFEDNFGYVFNENASCVWLGVWSLVDALQRTASSEPAAIKDALAATDISGEHPALLLTLAKGVKYEDGETPGGVVLYNQNRQFDYTYVWSCIVDGEFRVVWPEEYANPDYADVVNTLFAK